MGGGMGLGHTSNRGTEASHMGADLAFVEFGTGLSAVDVVAGGRGGVGVGTVTCALFTTHVVKCWGEGADASLGRGDLTDIDTPEELGDNLDPIDLGDLGGSYPVDLSISFSKGHVCAVLNDGRMKCWGTNGYGQLGVGDNQRRGDALDEMGDSLPFVQTIANEFVVQVATTTSSTCALLASGVVKCWGLNENAQLGHGHPVISGNEYVGDEPHDYALGGIQDTLLGSSYTTTVAVQGQTRLDVGGLTGTWTRITVAYESSNQTMSIYQDGVQLADATIDMSQYVSSTRLSYALGGPLNGSATYGFSGDLDEIKLWGSALSNDPLAPLSPSGGTPIVDYVAYIGDDQKMNRLSDDATHLLQVPSDEHPEWATSNPDGLQFLYVDAPTLYDETGNRILYDVSADVPPASGNFMLQPGAEGTYVDVKTVGGESLIIGFSHWMRSDFGSGADTLGVFVGNSFSDLELSYTTISAEEEWTEQGFVYDVPVGVTSVRILFKPLVAEGGDFSSGNLIDRITVKPVPIRDSNGDGVFDVHTRDSDGDGAPDDMDYIQSASGAYIWASDLPVGQLADAKGALLNNAALGASTSGSLDTFNITKLSFPDSLSTGLQHSCVLEGNGSVLCWGKG
ncbi:MAG TPA: LamG-like jellyroll fold domain-containing protein, partial [Candidatus Poseidoniales archaeon]|nr:LamG-like jellyroll fold domain-containing protein [Candidatus Poseidoniales archaeon]